MVSKKIQLLRDPSVQISDQVISNALDDAYPSFQEFISLLVKEEINLEWRYYTAGKAWLGKGIYRWVGTRGAKKETTVFWLSIWEGFFKISVFIHENYREKIIGIVENNDVKKLIMNTQKMGKTLKYLPLVFDVSTTEMFPSVFSLFQFKKDHDK